MQFARKLIDWQRRHGRNDLPWQASREPYRIWLSEVMLQQTQVAAVIPYYLRFLERFPTIEALAAASQEEVLRLWSGLGYYARGRNLHAAARRVVELGAFPASAEEIARLPGIGRSTAAAIAAFAYQEPAAILDGNVKRVLARCFGIAGWPGETAVAKALWTRAEALVPSKDVATYTQALMDLGATVCTRAAPRCGACPLAADCEAKKRGQTAAIPAPRPRKALPQKSVRWLVLQHRRKLLLEKRPPAGIWGGLWSFPEAPSRHLEAYCRASLGCDVSSRRTLEPLEHGFTHFRLRIRPLLCEVSRVDRLESPGRLWMDLGQARDAAVPAPVRTLVASLAR